MVNPQAMLQTAHDVIREASEMFVAGVGAAPVLYKKHGD